MNLQSDARNLSMVMDFYKMTMANGYFMKANTKDKVAFDVFYRKNPDAAGFAIFAGLQQIISYIQNLHFSKDDINYLRKQKLFSEEFLVVLYKLIPDIICIEETVVLRNAQTQRFLTRLQGVIYGWAICHECEFNTLRPT